MLKAVERVFYQCQLLCCHGPEFKRLTFDVRGLSREGLGIFFHLLQRK